LGYSETELKIFLEKFGFIIGGTNIAINQSKIEMINNYYENFDIEKSYNIKLTTRFNFWPQS